ncbi:MAG: malate dehydrogenase, partial [Planctomycetes bacterium]|nr:malate dehydrogenase [Planctomycetota bacterium]
TAPVTLVDVKEGMTTGKALDLMEAGPLRGYDTHITGADSIEAISGSDLVVIAAGRVRQPGERRADLYADNSATIRAICRDVKRLAPGAVVINLVEPVDLLTTLAQRVLEFDRRRVLGIGGLLTSTRLRYLVSDLLGVSPREVTAVVVGPHDANMVFLKDTIRVSGIPVRKLIPEQQLDELVEEARTAGDAILSLAQRSTSYYGPSAAAAAVVEAVARDTRATLPVSVVCAGEYGVDDLAIGVLARIGICGVREILPVGMSEAEAEAFRTAVAELRGTWDQFNRRESEN